MRIGFIPRAAISLLAGLFSLSVQAALAQHPDFNGDGFADLAVGVPGEGVTIRAIPPVTVDDAGAVNVLYGSAVGLTAQIDQFWSQAPTNVLDAPEKGDNFGASLAWGDFDGDGFDDLAVGVPDEGLGAGKNLAGAVNVFYGSVSGLAVAGNQFWTQDSLGVPDAAESADEFGGSLSAGDFNGDGFDDLVVSARSEDLGGVEDAGLVIVLPGSAGGLTSAGSQLWTQDSPGIPDKAEKFDGFGFSVTTGDFDGDGFDDLAIGAVGEDLELRTGTVGNAGVVHVLYGSEAGLVSAGTQIWSQNSPGVPETAEVDDDFGQTLAAGDFDGDRFDDLVVGVPTEDRNGVLTNTGAVQILYGSQSGLTATGTQLFTQESAGILDTSEPDDVFGFALAAGDMNDDDRDDLAIGVPDEDLDAGPVTNQGAVAVLYGSATGLAAVGNQRWSQDTPGIPDAGEDGDNLGVAVHVADFDGSGAADLAAGAFSESVGLKAFAGAVNVFYGQVGTGLVSAGAQFWTQDSPGVANQAENGDAFGGALSAQKGFNGFLVP